MTPPPANDHRDAEPGADVPRAGRGPGLKRNMVALATAGVLTVYAAGYARTESAAKRVDRDEGGRTLPPPEAAVGESPAATTIPEPVSGDSGTSTPGAATAESAAAGPARFRDGLYTGWGNSQHGKIEATVEVSAGRIVSARISTCKTRWPCARIALLVPQVTERQSQEVDVITGATHSSDAFYYALVEALAKAK